MDSTRYGVATIWSKEHPPPRGGFLFTLFPHQEPWVRGPPFKHLVQFFEGSPLTHGSWWGNIVNRKPPRRGGVLSINVVCHSTDYCSTAVFGMHVVCASALVWSLPGGLLHFQQEAGYFRVLFQQTNKQTNKVSGNRNTDQLVPSVVSCGNSVGTGNRNREHFWAWSPL